ncbi:hypothetical protein ACFWAX_41630, partial [Streptomyces sp. NPDC059956]|uniref:hypothetical protein n=1 Tax=Streptomyces sp. NPDC059956 TaxID=3347015 RepID=UPI0036534CC6
MNDARVHGKGTLMSAQRSEDGARNRTRTGHTASPISLETQPKQVKSFESISRICLSGALSG